MSAHAIKLYAEGGLGITVELVHTGPCEESANHDGECVLIDWVENVGEDLVQGEVTVPVRVEWLNDDSPVLHLQPSSNEERLRGALEALIESVERDRREPDKVLCHLQSARGVLLREDSWQFNVRAAEVLDAARVEIVSGPETSSLQDSEEGG